MQGVKIVLVLFKRISVPARVECRRDFGNVIHVATPNSVSTNSPTFRFVNLKVHGL